MSCVSFSLLERFSFDGDGDDGSDNSGCVRISIVSFFCFIIQLNHLIFMFFLLCHQVTDCIFIFHFVSSLWLFPSYAGVSTVVDKCDIIGNAIHRAKKPNTCNLDVNCGFNQFSSFLTMIFFNLSFAVVITSSNAFFNKLAWQKVAHHHRAAKRIQLQIFLVRFFAMLKRSIISDYWVLFLIQNTQRCSAQNEQRLISKLRIDDAFFCLYHIEHNAPLRNEDEQTHSRTTFFTWVCVCVSV